MGALSIINQQSKKTNVTLQTKVLNPVVNLSKKAATKVAKNSKLDNVEEALDAAVDLGGAVPVIGAAFVVFSKISAAYSEAAETNEECKRIIEWVSTLELLLKSMAKNSNFGELQEQLLKNVVRELESFRQLSLKITNAKNNKLKAMMKSKKDSREILRLKESVSNAMQNLQVGLQADAAVQLQNIQLKLDKMDK